MPPYIHLIPCIERMSLRAVSSQPPMPRAILVVLSRQICPILLGLNHRYTSWLNWQFIDGYIATSSFLWICMPTYLRADCYALYLVGVSDHLSDFKQNCSRYPPKPVSSYTSECGVLDAMPLQCYFFFKSFHEISYSYESLILSSSDLLTSHLF